MGNLRLFYILWFFIALHPTLGVKKIPKHLLTFYLWKVLYQFLETGTSDKTFMGQDQELKWLAFCLYPLLFFLYSPFKETFPRYSAWFRTQWGVEERGTTEMKIWKGFLVLVLVLHNIWFMVLFNIWFWFSIISGSGL